MVGKVDDDLLEMQHKHSRSSPKMVDAAYRWDRMRLAHAAEFGVGEDVLRLRLVPDPLGPNDSDLLGGVGIVPEEDF